MDTDTVRRNDQSLVWPKGARDIMHIGLLHTLLVGGLVAPQASEISQTRSVPARCQALEALAGQW